MISADRIEMSHQTNRYWRVVGFSVLITLIAVCLYLLSDFEHTLMNIDFNDGVLACLLILITKNIIEGRTERFRKKLK